MAKQKTKLEIPPLIATMDKTARQVLEYFAKQYPIVYADVMNYAQRLFNGQIENIITETTKKTP